jgi:XRE family transcriptional regulator, fatty acid utilization regulator
MSGSKIFAGAKLRRMRNGLNLNQTTLAQSLGISASYLNLIERDQRPITAQLLLKLHMLHGADIADLSGNDEQSDVLASLREVVADPLLNGEIPVPTELTQALDVAPNLVGATIKLYRAYREVLKRLGDVSYQMAEGAPAPSTTAFEDVQHWLQENPIQPALENLAEEIWFDLSPKDDVFAGIKARLRAASGIDVRIIPIDIMGHDRARHDRHSQRLFISERLNASERLFEAALLLARLEAKSVIEQITATFPFQSNAEATRLLHAGLFAQLAASIICPAAKFQTAAADLRWNIEALGHRFCCSAATVMKRLSQLSLREGSTMPIGFLQVDSTGVVLNKLGRIGFHLPRSDALCGHLPHFTGEHAVKLEFAEGKSVVMIAKRDGPITSAICLTKEDVAKTIYSTQTTRPLGPTCRLCEIKACALRRAPQATRPAALNEFVRGPSDFEAV